MANEIAKVTPYGFETEADFNMVNHLLRKPRYKIPEHLRDKIIGRAALILEHEDDKTALSAANTLVAMDKINVDIIRISMPKKVEHKNIDKMSQEELESAISDIRKRLPEVIPHA